VDIRADGPTYNYGRMIRKADEIMGGEGCSFAAIHDVTGEKAKDWFSKILHAVVSNEVAIRALAPENGWGTFEQLREMFTEYLRLSEEHPKAIWTQSGDGSKKMRCCAGWVCGE
jgi:hypothetical protein